MTPPRWRLRPATEADDAFLLTVVAATRPELALLSLPPEQTAAFVALQHRAQLASYRAAHPDAQLLVVEVDGAPAGRLFLARVEGEGVRVLDIALLPEHRGHGLGTALLAEVIAAAERDGLDVTLHVEHSNPARRLYARLGFVVTERDDVYARMVRRVS